MGFLRTPKTIEELEDEEERTDHQLSISEKRALIAEAKKRYGKDWRLRLPKIESGMDWSALKFRMQ